MAKHGKVARTVTVPTRLTPEQKAQIRARLQPGETLCEYLYLLVCQELRRKRRTVRKKA